ncbi:MAG: SDR family NAD(P)-dependent oxidoreductase [Candidatus Peribacteraceae bacterium]|nr:SDR family NAD(P)-dependent oxidoreductase [Candidatus Peribacteraceae bacterium]
MESYVLITGASSGIGRATAVRLAKEKKNLILVARRQEKLSALEKELKPEGVKVVLRPLDLLDRKALEKMFNELKEFPLEAVINNAGKALGRDPLDKASDEDLQGMIDLNISAFLRVVLLSIPHLKKTQGHLVNIGSIAGLEIYENGATYCGTKHFVHAINQGARIDLLGSGIRVTEINPGNVDTEFSVVRYHGDTEKAKKVYQGYEPLHAEDVAEAIWYALSRPKHVNIQQIVIVPTAQTTTGKIARKES